MTDRRRLEKAAPWVVTSVSSGLWELASFALAIPKFILPSPRVIGQSLMKWHAEIGISGTPPCFSPR